MPFSASQNATATARRGWTRSLLPFTSSPPKHTRKSRKRASFADFILSNFFTLGIITSILFFLFVVYLYGVPAHIASPFRSRTSRLIDVRKRIRREPSGLGVLPPDHYNVSGAVDITTKDLYDRIEFKDEDGGPWKQGWRVSYKGDEWDAEKLKVFVVPHSHNDPGWKLTVEEYYDKQSRHILDTIVETLSKDERRKFIWEEMSFLERWWRDASDAKKENFSNLVHNGQLEIVGGGWVMNDEANSHYFAIIDQVIRGDSGIE